MSVERVLITGGKGKTGRRVASRLTATGIDVAIGTRSPDGPQDRYFDWADPSSASAFEHAMPSTLSRRPTAPTT